MFSLYVDIAGSGDPYMWRNFTIGALTAREGQMDQFFFAIMAFHIQIVREKAKNMTKNSQKPTKKVGFSQFLK